MNINKRIYENIIFLDLLSRYDIKISKKDAY